MSISNYTVCISRALAVTGFVAFLISTPISASAQSGSKQTGTQQQSGSASKSSGSDTKQSQPAMEGYCPVCIIDMKKWVRGNEQFQSTFDGQTYLFPGQEQKTAFEADPAKYVPVLGGDCVVAYKKMGERVAGNIRHAAFNNGRLFLFSEEMAQKEFLANQETYSNVDVAFGGLCTVCKVEMEKDVEGNPEIAVLYQGMRYYFPSDEQKSMFIANPDKYSVSMTSTKAEGSSSK